MDNFNYHYLISRYLYCNLQRIAKISRFFMAEGQVLVDTTDVDGFFDNPTEPRAVQFLSKIIDHNSDRVQVDA